MFQRIQEWCYKGTSIILWNQKQDYLMQCRELLIAEWFIEIQIPIIQYRKMFENKVWEENNNMMFEFKDRWDRDICLAPEYTSIRY